jgi:predicted ATPase
VIERLVIRNFRCIRHAEVSFAPLTVLVGPNASGKSTVLDALVPRQFAGLDYWQYGPANTPSISLSPAGQRHEVQALRLDLQRLRLPNQVSKELRLDPSGQNLPNLLYSLTRKQRDDLARQLCRLVPVFADLDLEPTGGGNHTLRYQDRWNEAVWFNPAQVSDGTLLITAFLSLQYQSQVPTCITVEEPERGLHPFLMGELMTFLRDMSAGKVGPKPIQVVLATHSAELLEHARPEEVRFLDRDPKDGTVTVHSVDPKEPGWEDAYREYGRSLGSAWLSGGLGGVP